MTTRTLPQQPSLPQLRKQAKELLRAVRSGDSTAVERVTAQLQRLAKDARPISLSLAQLALAREYGFDSWPKLKIFVETQGFTFEEKLRHFVDAAMTGRLYFANHLLKSEPKLASYSLGTACLIGDVEAVRRMLAKDPKLATTPIGRWNWLPIVYATHSSYHEESAEKRQALLDITQLLLEHGADPNSTYSVTYLDGQVEGPNPVIYGPAGHTNFPELAELLLKAGANPDEKEALYHSTEFPDHRCTRLLLQYGARPTKWGALHHQLDRDDLAGVKLLLEAGADPNGTYENLGTALHHAIIRGRSGAFVELLLQSGADPSRTDTSGRNAAQIARRFGNLDALRALKAPVEEEGMSPRDAFLAACARADETRARSLLKSNPILMQSLSEEDRKLLATFAELGKIEAVKLMLDLGFDVNQAGEWGPAIQHAAWHAQTDLVKLFIGRGANLEAENRYGGTALGCALYATQFWKCAGDEYVPVVEALLEAGSTVKPYHLTMGNEAVTEVVKAYAE